MINNQIIPNRSKNKLSKMKSKTTGRILNKKLKILLSCLTQVDNSRQVLKRAQVQRKFLITNTNRRLNKCIRRAQAQRKYLITNTNTRLNKCIRMQQLSTGSKKSQNQSKSKESILNKSLKDQILHQRGKKNRKSEYRLTVQLEALVQAEESLLSNKLTLKV